MKRNDMNLVIDLVRESTGSWVKGYKLPDIFIDLSKWQDEHGEDWCEVWHNDVAEWVGEEFNWEWMPVDLRPMTDEEYAEVFENE